MKFLRLEESPVTYEFHPAASIFPMMSDQEAKDLMVDIRENGQREPIVLFKGKVIDGRNRLRALRWLKIEPEVREFEGTEEDVVSYVVSLNLHRRHLTESQRAMVASKLATMKVGHPASNSANLRNRDAAKMLSVSTRSVEAAKRIVAKGEPEVAAAVESGTMTLHEAGKVVHLRPEIQRQVANLPKAERKETLRGNTPEEMEVAHDDQWGLQRVALIRVLAELNRIEGPPEELIGDTPKYLAPDLNEQFRKAFMKMQALNAAYANWRHRNVQAD